jgi:hypothetical protein
MKAFPIANMEGDEEFLGMDLRDYFAAKAMPIITETYKNSWIEDNNFEGYSDEEMICIAEGSYEMADAMMEARKK